jgi:lipopolysaccharide biosynthesis regulator YciM
LDLHFQAGTFRTVEMGALKAEEQSLFLSSRTNVSFSRFNADVVCLRALAMTQSKTIDFTATRKEFERALSLCPNHARARVGLAKLLQRQGEIDTALSLMSEERNNDQTASEEARELCGILLVQAGLLKVRCVVFFFCFVCFKT